LTGVPGRIALTALRAYKVFISPYFWGSCRFFPSCADYAAEAIEHHGLARGGWLAVCRLGRCHPFCTAGIDPVPLARSTPPESQRFETAASGEIAK
jgi:putative membrane protein insertion efficiency factor